MWAQRESCLAPASETLLQVPGLDAATVETARQQGITVLQWSSETSEGSQANAHGRAASQVRDEVQRLGVEAAAFRESLDRFAGCLESAQCLAGLGPDSPPSSSSPRSRVGSAGAAASAAASAACSAPEPPRDVMDILPELPPEDYTLVEPHDNISESSKAVLGERQDLKLRREWVELHAAIVEQTSESQGQSQLRRTISHVSSMDHQPSKTTFKRASIGFQSPRESFRRRTEALAGGGSERATLFQALRPHDKARVSWDVACANFLMSDVVLIPYAAAWGIDIGRGTFLFYICMLGALFWSMDIVLSFKTAFYAEGMLVTDFRRIAAHYVKTYFVFDVFCVFFDVFLLYASDGPVGRLSRIIRTLRLFRLLRLSKLGKLSESMEDACSGQHQTSILAIVVAKIFVGIFTIAHVLACAWYAVGRSQGGGPSWLDNMSYDSNEGRDEYFQAFHWTLCQFTPAPISIRPASRAETIFNVCVIWFSTLVLGSCFSKLTSSMNELRKWNEDNTKRKRQLQQYLVRNAVPLDLSVRIERFANGALHREARTIAESSVLRMLSAGLKAELHVVQRAPLLVSHPFFALMRAFQPEAFGSLCSAVAVHVYESQEVVFASGSWAQCMYATVRGSYRLQERIGSSIGCEIFDEEHRFFADACLFSCLLHEATLRTETMADVLTLSAASFQEALHDSPVFITAVYEYANSLFGLMQAGQVSVRSADVLPAELAREACQATGLAKRQQEEEELDRLRSSDENAAHRIAQQESRFGRGSWLFRQELLRADTVAKAVSREQTPESPMHRRADEDEFSDVPGGVDPSCAVREFVQRALQQSQPLDDSIVEEIEVIFAELDPQDGIYAYVEHLDERLRAEAAMLSVFWLRRGLYEEFVRGQDPSKRMSSELWAELQECDLWTEMSEDELHAILVFLAIRGLGKAKKFAALVPMEISGTPEKCVMYAMDEMPHVLPTAQKLLPATRRLVHSILDIHSKFNFAQFLQGENTPSRIHSLQVALQQQGEGMLKLYLAALVAMMSGLQGSQSISGSLFMDQVNGSSVVLAIQSLRMLGTWTPHKVYWTYIWSRAQRLGVHISSAEQLALARLLCLRRVSLQAEVRQLQDAWHALGRSDETTLAKHLLANGICERAFVFVFLPTFLANASGNRAVGLQLALSVLLEVLEMLHTHNGGEQASSLTVKVDLSDLAAFAREVRARHAFEVCISHALLIQVGEARTFKLVMTGKNWNRARTSAAADQDQAADVAHRVLQVSRKQLAIQSSLGTMLQRLDGHDGRARQLAHGSCGAGSAEAGSTASGPAPRAAAPCTANGADADVGDLDVFLNELPSDLLVDAFAWPQKPSTHAR